jgi:perosamine synthetase
VRYSIFAGSNTSLEAFHALPAALGLARVGDGPEIAEYESKFAGVAGTRHAISFAAGRMALFALLEALEIKSGDEVVLPAFTCVVVPNAVLYAGARPVYVDIDRSTYNLDPSQLERAITPRTKLIVAQHTFGLICDIDEIKRIAERHGIAVIEDSALALGATHNGRPAGSLARAAYFSTDHTKIISTGIGGMVTTDDDEIASRVRAIQHRSAFLPAWKARLSLLDFAIEAVATHPMLYRWLRFPYKVLWRLGFREAFFRDELSVELPTRYPYPGRLGRAHAQIGLSQLALLPANLAWRRRLGLLYEQTAGQMDGVLAPDATNHAFLRYSWDADDRAKVERIFKHVLEMNPWFTSVVHGRNHDLDAVGYVSGGCPNAEHAAAHCVNLPTHPRVSNPLPLVARLAKVTGLKRSAEVPHE